MKFSKFLKVIDDDSFYLLVLFPFVFFFLIFNACCHAIDVNSFLLLKDLNNLIVSGVESIISWTTLVFWILYSNAELNHKFILRKLKVIEERCFCL